MTYGPHLMVEAYGCDRRALSDLGVMYRFLNALPPLIGMKAISPPFVIDYVDEDPDESGVTGGIFISTSHLAFHSYPSPARDCALFFDAFSCKPFDSQIVLDYIEKTFSPRSVIHKIDQRGKYFPRPHLESK